MGIKKLVLLIALSVISADVSAQFDNENLANGKWIYINQGDDCAAMSNAGSCPEGRHEAAYVQAGDKFYLIGGRENGSNVNCYDPKTNTWTTGAKPPLLLHHFQALEHQGLIYVIGAMTGNFPAEPPIEQLFIYDPAADKWHKGPAIPEDRRRGSAGVVKYKEKIYIASGIRNGHIDGWVPWLDEYDPRTNTWRPLPDAPRSRDHFHAVVVGDKLYLAAGRRSNHGGPNGSFSDTEPLVDVYDFSTQKWTTLENPIPTERAGNTVAVLDDKLLVIGGEKQPGAAHSETEALDPSTGEWTTLAPLNTGRHGSQAIVSNGGVYIAAGSPKRGGGQLRSQEAFFPGQPTRPEGSPLKASFLRADKTRLKLTAQAGLDQVTEEVVLSNRDGNQGILITSITLEDGADFHFEFPYSLPYLLHTGESVALKIFGNRNAPSERRSVTIEHSGSNEPIILRSGAPD